MITGLRNIATLSVGIGSDTDSVSIEGSDQESDSQVGLSYTSPLSSDTECTDVEEESKISPSAMVLKLKKKVLQELCTFYQSHPADNHSLLE